MPTSNREPTELSRPLTALGDGDEGFLNLASVDPADRDLLAALGLVDRSPLRLCKSGAPWIVQVRGTRIGLSDEVARRLQITERIDGAGESGTASDPAGSSQSDE